MRTVGVVTVGRSDFWIYLPLLRKIQEDPQLRLFLIVSGQHWIDRFGLTAKDIEKIFPISAKVEIPLEDDSPHGIACSCGEALKRFASCYAENQLDILVVLGDRFEMHSAAQAALYFKIPVAHIHGGELTEGAFDNSLRHSITKLSHLHFTATEEYSRRVQQMGEEKWRVTISGAPALDHLAELIPLSFEELAKKYHLPTDSPPVVVTYHPVTLQYEETEWQMTELLAALEKVEQPIVFTGANPDTSNRIVRQKIDEFLQNRNNTFFVPNFGGDYFSLLTHALIMVGNSSSGIIEAPSFHLPVVNIGIRQRGRIRAENVIDVGHAAREILSGIRTAISPEFRRGLRDLKNSYWKGGASRIIHDVLKKTSLDDLLVIKKFSDRLL